MSLKSHPWNVLIHITELLIFKEEILFRKSVKYVTSRGEVKSRGSLFQPAKIELRTDVLVLQWREEKTPIVFNRPGKKENQEIAVKLLFFFS